MVKRLPLALVCHKTKVSKNENNIHGRASKSIKGECPDKEECTMREKTDSIFNVMNEHGKTEKGYSTAKRIICVESFTHFGEYR